jgi:hypothetical protein
MKQTVDYHTFEQAFKNYDRLNNFPIGLRDLFDYLESYESDCDTEIELDVIALRCDYSEDLLSTVLKENDLGSLEELQQHTTVIEVTRDEDPTIIYQAF